MQTKVPRLLIAAAQSGSGKTTVTCAILQMLVNKGLAPASFKCGPDYIDGMFHSKIIGATSRNLDAFFCEENTIKYLLSKNSSSFDISIIEGVMGFYDGLNLNSDKASSYHIAKITNTPVVLLVNCKGMASSVIAMIKGFVEYKKDSNIKGVILNNMTKNTYQTIKPQIEDYFENKIEVLGFLPKLPQNLVLASRHLGLVTAQEITDLKQQMQSLAEIAKETIDLQKLINLANTAQDICYDDIKIPTFEDIKIAVAYDNVSCFYYKDNLDLLQKMGAKIEYFSFLKDKQLPQNINGLYIGGGYPELYKQEISQNQTLLTQIKNAVQNNIPLIAECGGFMCLCKSIEEYPMADIFDAECYNTGKLSRFGYVEMTANSDNLLCKKGEKIKAHEFHYYDSTDNSNGFTIEKQNKTSWQGVFTGEYIYAGYPHLHFFQDIGIAVNFYKKCLERKNQKC